MNELNIDNPAFVLIKEELNSALAKAVREIGELDTGTIRLTIDIEQSDVGFNGSKTLMPINFTCSVTTKRDVMKNKGMTQEVIIRENEDGALLVMNQQVSFFDLASGDDYD